MDQEQLKINLWLKTNLPKSPTRNATRKYIKPPVQYQTNFKYTVDNRHYSSQHSVVNDPSAEDISSPLPESPFKAKSLQPTDHRDSSGEQTPENDFVKKLKLNFSEYVQSLPRMVYNEVLQPPMISWRSELTELYGNQGAFGWKSFRNLDL